MAVPTNKTELVEAIRGNYLKLRTDLDGVPEALSRERTLEGHARHTVMSVHDLTAYLVGWGELVLKWHAGRNAGQQVDFPETGYKWNELGRLAQKFYADHADLTYPALLDRFASTKDRILTAIEKTGNEDLYGKPWYETYTLGRMIQLNTSSPFDNARKRLRRWKKEKGLA
ncbi:ClbS/DfsB family four-helix bundle protein [Pleomorphomonas sp. JP5]|uniref:ClbS/DfsB family four-helix bundle protein n=1 Tax=Pleomorphomonas sp. JP5 TaxID=2942998 RepID=UPI002043046F|nr:ClbS/DfsB family four-helix bundle protein [Pleomorphomonas sp. JP5]MCM5559935.1 ClbS/DfsB family four-helix bundle protein [Pleomorphomonas sp. JP5]